MMAVYRDHWSVLQRVVPLLAHLYRRGGWMSCGPSSYTCSPRTVKRSARGSLRSYAGGCRDREVMP